MFSTRFWFLLNIMERALEKADDNLQGCLERRGLLTKARIKISSTPIKRSKLIFCNMNIRAIQLQHFLFSWFLSFWDRWCNCKWKYRSMEFCFPFSWGKNNICQCFPDKRPKYALLKPQVRVMSVSQLAPSITPAKNASSNRWSWSADKYGQENEATCPWQQCGQGGDFLHAQLLVHPSFQ